MSQTPRRIAARGPRGHERRARPSSSSAGRRGPGCCGRGPLLAGWPRLLRAPARGPREGALRGNRHPIKAPKAPPSRHTRSPVPGASPLSLVVAQTWSEVTDLVGGWLVCVCVLSHQPPFWFSKSRAARRGIPRGLGLGNRDAALRVCLSCGRRGPARSATPTPRLGPTRQLEKESQSDRSCALWTGFWRCWGSVVRPAVTPQVPRTEGQQARWTKRE